MEDHSLFCENCGIEVDALDGSAEAHRQKNPGHTTWLYLPAGPRGTFMRAKIGERWRRGIKAHIQLTRSEGEQYLRAE